LSNMPAFLPELTEALRHKKLAEARFFYRKCDSGKYFL
jgi:hypothetical protein